jgi:serine acetyltransferase/thymidylate kinase
MDDRSRVALSLFRFLERNGIAYCVMGDTRAYPETIASDVDIVVEQKAFRGVPRLVARFARAIGAHVVQWIRHEQTASYFVLSWARDSGGIDFLALDFCGDYYRRGRRLLAADEILAQRGPAIDGRGREQGFQVPAAHVQFIYYLLKKVDKEELDHAHGDYLSDRWHADPGGALIWICRYWPEVEDAEVISRAAEDKEWFLVRGLLPRLRRALGRSAPFSFAGALGELRRRVERVLRPTGMTVAVIGPDGSGKSSVIELVLAGLAPAFRGTRYLHLRPRVVGGGRASSRPATAPHALPPRGRVASVAKLVHMLLDYVAGYALRVWPLTRRSTLVVFDRYYRDLLVDPRRYRYGGPMSLARWAAKCVPGPDLWVLLDAPGDVLQARKSEVSAEESARQRQSYLELAAHLWNAAVVDATQELPLVAVEVEAAILNALEGRLELRHPELRFDENPVAARLLQFFCRRRTPVLAKLMRILLNCDVYCRIHSPILMAHPYGIVIHSDAVIGHRVTIMQQVTLGAKDGGMRAAPVIGDDVYIGAGAKVLGAVRVGRGAVIGANAVVTRDVPPYCTVVGANRIVRAPEPFATGESGSRAEDPVPARERLSA